jgi:hypothetical protein
MKLGNKADLEAPLKYGIIKAQDDLPGYGQK